MPDHIRYLLKHAAIGTVVGLIFVALVLAFDIAGLRHLVANTQGGFVALTVMSVFFVITFGSVQMGIAVMRLGADDTDTDGGGPRQGAPVAGVEPLPVRVPVRQAGRADCGREHRRGGGS